MKKLIYISFVTLVLLSCDKEDSMVNVRYEAGNAYSDTELTYRDGDGEMITETISFESAEDVWRYNTEAEQGGIVYLSARYQDSASSVRIRIIIDGKVYKEGSSNNEPEKYLTVSGTVPYK